MNSSGNTSFNPAILCCYSAQRYGASIAEHIVELKEIKHPILAKITYGIFANEEIKPVVDKRFNLAGTDSIIIAGAAGTPNNIIKEVQFLRAIAKDGGAKTVTVVIPYLFYGRQDSNFGERAPIALEVVIKDLFENTDYALIIDPHNPSATKIALKQVASTLKRSSFVHFTPLIAQHIMHFSNRGLVDLSRTKIIGLDKGGVTRATQEFIESIRTITGIPLPDEGKHLPYLDKDRDYATGETIYLGLKNSDGDIEGCDIVAPEDMVDSGGSVINAAKYLKEKLGARSVIVPASNGIFSAKRIRIEQDLQGFDGEPMRIVRYEKNPDPTDSIKKIDAATRGEHGPDLILVSEAFDFDLTDPKVAEAIRLSPAIHSMRTTRFIADLICALTSNDTTTNSITRRLAGDPDFFHEYSVPFRPIDLKLNNPLLKRLAA